MPTYVFRHPCDEETIELFFHMNDEKEYIDNEGIEWERVFLASEVNAQSKIDPWNNEDFVKKTGDSEGTLGDLMDRSAELSAKRAEEAGGTDPVKEKYYKNYAKDRKGALHADKMNTYETEKFKVNYDKKPRRKT